MADFSIDQITQIDAVYNATIELCRIMIGADAENIEVYGPIADLVADALSKSGHAVNFPYEENGVIHDYF